MPIRAVPLDRAFWKALNPSTRTRDCLRMLPARRATEPIYGLLNGNLAQAGDGYILSNTKLAGVDLCMCLTLSFQVLALPEQLIIC